MFCFSASDVETGIYSNEVKKAVTTYLTEIHMSPRKKAEQEEFHSVVKSVNVGIYTPQILMIGDVYTLYIQTNIKIHVFQTMCTCRL